MSVPLIFEIAKPAVRCSYITPSDLPESISGPAPELLRETLDLPQVAEPEVMRHFVNLSTLNHHVDKGFYPLGSCTMKYNPKVNDQMAGLSGFGGLHPHQPANTIQGALRLMQVLQNWLCEITGMECITTQPVAGSHGEMTGLFTARAYHIAKGNRRKKVIVPDSAHGTNPASIVLSGWEPVTIKSKADGRIDMDSLMAALDEDVAVLMITNPNTLGLFETEIKQIAKAVHDVGALMYMDGANMNALVGLARPGDMGFDIVHLNLHKTFSTPHGGGGPGSGPVAVAKILEEFLPVPRIVEDENGTLNLSYNFPNSIGKIHSFFGNFGMLVRAYTYIRALGADGLRNVAETAILNANYIRSRLEKAYKIPYTGLSMHEVVFSADLQAARGCKATDIAKRLLDFDMHAPTIYFPLIVHEAMMVEPTETETIETLDYFCDTMLQIDEESKTNLDILHSAPHKTPVTRMDEAGASKRLDINFKPNREA